MGFGQACAEAHIHWARGLHRLGVVTLSALLGLLLWATGVGIVAIWLIVLATLAWAAFWSTGWVLAGFRADSTETIPRKPSDGPGR
jgi:hypothetical protein